MSHLAPRLCFCLGLLAGCSTESAGGAPQAAPIVATAMPPVTAAPAPVPTATASPVATASATGTAAAACGERGQPNCPLQAFMKTKMGPANQARDLATVASLLDLVATASPDPSWNSASPSWAQISTQGAAAARANDLNGVRASCKACHDGFRNRYKTEHRARPVPPSMQ